MTCSILYEDPVYLLGGVRTPFGKFCGGFQSISPTDLGIISSRGALERTGTDPTTVDQVVYANITQSSFDAIYIPRHVSLYSGIPQETPALLVQRICGSGFEALIQGTEQIVLGKANTVLAGGAENMTLNPSSSFGARLGHRLGSNMGYGDMLWEGLMDPASGCTMGRTAENLAEKYEISREDVDEYALRSHQRGLAATNDGTLSNEIVSVSSGAHEQDGLSARKFRTTPSRAAVEKDEMLRETDAAALAGLRPSFGGVQTAGNSSGIVDGSASVVVASEKVAGQRDGAPLARIAASASVGVDPSIMGIGPVPAIKAVLEVASKNLDDIGLFEINEAFGAQYLAVERALELDREKVNVNGGAIAIGHPLAATGTRLTLTLALEMQRRKVQWGIASACIGGGQGTAVLLENTALGS